MIGALLKDTVVYGLSSLLTKGLAVILLPLYTYVLTQREFGIFDLSSVLGVLVTLTVALEVSQGVARLQADEDERERNLLLSSAWWFSCLAYTTFFVVCVVAAPWLARTVFHGETSAGICRVAALSIAVGGLYSLLLNQFRWDLRSRTYAGLSILYAVGVVALTLTFTLGLGWGLGGALLAQCVSGGLVAAVAWVLLSARIHLIFSAHALGRMLRFSAPLVPSGLASFATLYFNRLALNHFGTLADVAVFGLASRIAGVSSLLVLGLQGALTPLIYRHYQEAETPAHLARLFSWFVAAAMFLCLTLTFGAPLIVSILSPATYASASILVPLLAPGVLLAQMYIFAPGIALAKRTTTQLAVIMTAGAVSITSNLVLVPVLGGLGAATATLLASATMFGLWATMSQRHYPIPFPSRPLVGAVLAYAVLTCVGLVLADQLRSEVVTLSVQTAMLIVFAWLLVKSGLVASSDLQTAVHAVRRR
ncbi:MAG: lipopolysaccharide biosynthesis protein, partial [Nocardioides sp.]